MPPDEPKCFKENKKNKLERHIKDYKKLKTFNSQNLVIIYMLFAINH
jgi:hypothetical protein